MVPSHNYAHGSTSVFILLWFGIDLQWCHNEHDGVSNQQRPDCLLNHFFQAQRSKKTSNLRVTGLCEGNPPETQRTSNAENVFIWWCRHGLSLSLFFSVVSGALEQSWIMMIIHKRTIKKQERHSRRNTLGCLDQYTGNILRLWNSRDHETV